MSKIEQKNPQINFKLHLILFFVTGSLWTLFYNLICFLKLNQLAKLTTKKNGPKNSAIAQFLIMSTILGAPFAFYRRFQLLHDYIEVQDLKETKSSDSDEYIRNCLLPGQFIGFAITTFLILGGFVSTLVISSLHIAEILSWGNDALLVLLPISVACFFTSIGFCARIVKEEKRWVKAFNQISNLMLA
ncbi:MAG: hypothetical protein FK733_04740 [Asgard group archaeon]|nr:hypothetical protein [Asgard group archaeon]